MDKGNRAHIVQSGPQTAPKRNPTLRDSYYLAHYKTMPAFVKCNLIEMRLTGFGELLRLRIEIDVTRVSDSENPSLPIFEMWSTWTPDTTKVDTKATNPVEVWNLKLRQPKEMKIGATYDRVTTFKCEGLEKIAGNEVRVCFSFETPSLLHALDEMEPYNRYMVSLGCRFPLSHANTRVILIRPYQAVGRFTRGNYVLAMPSIRMRTKLVSNIYYARENYWNESLFLNYGFGNDDSDNMTAPWSYLLRSGLALFGAFLLLSVRIPFYYTPPVEVVGSIGLLLVATYEAGKRYFTVERHAHYTGHTSLSVISFSISTAGSMVALVYIVLLAFRPSWITWTERYTAELLIAAYSLLFVALATAGVIALRVGVLQKYECDMPFCDNRLYLRAFSKQNPFTGRVFCKACYSKVKEDPSYEVRSSTSPVA